MQRWNVRFGGQTDTDGRDTAGRGGAEAVNLGQLMTRSRKEHARTKLWTTLRHLDPSGVMLWAWPVAHLKPLT